MYSELAASHPKIQRGMVWCTTCGSTLRVDPVKCLKSGWPMCCGQTMVIDSPEERKVTQEPPTTNSIAELVKIINGLWDKNAIHVRRGFRIQDIDSIAIGNHLIEEAVELQSAIIEKDWAQTIEEASDVLLILLQLLHNADPQISIGDVVHVAKQKLEKAFTTDQSKVTAKKPGFSRKNRGKYVPNP